MVYLLIDGDYLLSGFKPTSDEVVKTAVEALQQAVEQQLLQPRSGGGAAPPSYAAQIQIRVAFFSAALLGSLPESQHQSVVSTLRRLRFQVVSLESIRGRVGSPVDGALCTKIVALGSMPSADPPAFCLVAPTAYTASALDVVTSKGCDVTFVVYKGDEVAEPLLGYISPSFGGGVATMAKSEGVAYVQNTEAAASALAVLQQEGKDLPISVVSELKRLQNTLLDNPGRASSGASTTGRPSSALIMESTRRRKEEQALFQPPPPIQNCPNPFEDLQMNGGSRRNSTNTDNDNNNNNNNKESSAPGVLQQESTAEYPESRMLFGVRTEVSVETSPPSVVRVAKKPDGPPPPLPATSVVPKLPPAVLNQVPQGISTHVPSGWAMLYDADRHRYYYACTESNGTTRSTWEHPLGHAYSDEVEDAAEAWWVAKRQESEDQALAAAGATEALPQGWEERIQEETGRKYYVNHNTQETTWVPPTRQNAAAGGEPASSVASSAGRRTSAPASATKPAPSTTPSSATKKSSIDTAPLPEGWEEKTDPRNGRTYYVNHAKRETTWERPRPAEAAATQAQTPTPSAPSAKQSTTSTTATGGDEWESRIDPRNGRTYYVNHRTRETSWTKPTAAPATEEEWEAKVDPKTGRTFYVNHATQWTSWTIPTLAPAKAQTPPASVTSSQNSGPNNGGGALSYPWEERTDPTSGRAYYVNHATKQTTWTRPR